MTTAPKRPASADTANPSPCYRMRISAGPDDIDAQGHVSNVTYVRWVQDVAVAHSSAVGFPPEAYRTLKTVFVVRRHELDYLRPAYAGNEIELATQILWWRAAQCERETRIVRCQDGVLLASARTIWVYISTESGKPRRIPSVLEAAFYPELS